MSNDIERLLADAADDSDQPMHTTVDDLLIRARRSVRHRRIATAATAALTTAAVIGGMATWSATRSESEGPAGTPSGQTITIDAKTGRIVDNETGKTVTPAPPVSPLSDAEALARCRQYDRENVDFLREHKANVWDKAGPIDARWKVVVKSGNQNELIAMFLAPDKSLVATCDMDAPKKPRTNGRISTEVVKQLDPDKPQAVANGLRVPVPGVARVLVDLEGQNSPHEALVGTDGFFTIGYRGDEDMRLVLRRIRAYDANGKKVWEQVTPPVTFPSSTVKPVDPAVTVKTAEPIQPDVVLTKDPATRKALAPPPPVSPLTDEQITTRCRGVDDIYFKDAGRAPGNPNDSVIKAAGPVTKDWKVALKTGTGDKLTAILISPDKRVFAWCHMLGTTAKGPYDYTRGAVQADGKFADHFEWAMVPDGVAQIVVDLPKGPTRALVSNGFYIWGLTGGNSGLKQVRVRGFDAKGKQVYDAKKQLDVDFD
ncbi:hypothetical protein AB0L70_06340 [Kribbella sp. NPDC051952]|uniref:hypothetical protein n=1 Tax=Kribbella sp. NPDC051952 TaxID=3154851 RepID=UPI0034345AD5